ncbi:MAG: sensor histidine kinase, partial [Cyclobacteriaceae bacterium]
ALVFERSLDMLDHSISELRRVAHNMMPEVLVKFGLEEALKSYCDSVQQSGMLAVNFQTIGVYQRMPSEKEIIVYRIVQELVANVVKHSRARAVLVQLAWQPAILDLTVEDDGAGFDIAMLEYSRGAGWANIRSRAEFLRSKLDIQSSAGAGTSVHMTIPL